FFAAVRYHTRDLAMTMTMSKNAASRSIALPSQAAGQRRRKPVSQQTRAGLALAGGGPLGITYEIGALNALAESLEGIDFARLGVYVGVSAGSVVAAGCGQGIR